MSEQQTQVNERGLSKIREGYVTSNKMDKTIVVTVATTMRHPSYKKYVSRSKKYIAHDGENTCQIGDRVKIIECRPMSKRKRWRLQEVVARAV